MVNFDEIGTKYVENQWKDASQISSLGEVKVESLKEVIEEIDNLIKERENLSESFIKEGDKMKSDIKNFLLENAPRHDDDSEFARERAELRKKQIEIQELQLNEKVGCWRDIALLKRELREREKELSEKTSRAEMLSRILED